MKKTNLLIVIGLSLIIGGSALNITANFNNDEIKTTQPKKANENLNYFELELTQNGTTDYNRENGSDSFYYTSIKQEYSGYNNALMAKLELVNQNQTTDTIDLTTNETHKIPTLTNEPTQNNNTLIKYQITPYKSLYDSKTNQTLVTTINLNTTSEEEIKLKYKITTLTSKQDWSRYIGQTNWYAQLNNYNIIEEIKNPQNEQVYNETITVQELIISTFEYQFITIETDVQIIDEQTTYHFIFVEPYLESSTSTYGKLYTRNGYMGYIADTIPPKISGYMIPNIDNYEVIDLPGLLFNILTMPFAFISTAFNVTLFPGTPFQINLSNLFLTIMAILIFVFIVKLFINMKG